MKINGKITVEIEGDAHNPSKLVITHGDYWLGKDTAFKVKTDVKSLKDALHIRTAHALYDLGHLLVRSTKEAVAVSIDSESYRQHFKRSE